MFYIPAHRVPFFSLFLMTFSPISSLFHIFNADEESLNGCHYFTRASADQSNELYLPEHLCACCNVASEAFFEKRIIQ